MRNFSNAMLSQLQAERPTDLFLMLCTIVTDNGTFYFVNNNEDVTSRTQIYTAYAFDIQLMDDALGKLPTASIVLDNVDLFLVDTIRSITNPPLFTFELIRHEEPDQVEMTITDLKLMKVSFDSQAIQGELVYDDVFNQSFPSKDHTYNREQCPGLFYGV